jgi:VIT1/CCC1 family predicted Fe2+/Mn2+ transporter
MARNNLGRFSFGATSAVTSSLALMVGLNQLGVSGIGMIGALLVIGLADNIADSLGIHVYSESKSKNYTILDTVTNYLTRLVITLVPILFVIFLPMTYAIIASVVVGLAILAILSYLIAKAHKLNPYRNVVEHLVVAILVLIVSQLIGSSIKALLPA